jgi:predicted amidohydrolase
MGKNGIKSRTYQYNTRDCFMKIAAFQLSVIEDDPDATFEKVQHAIYHCRKADLVMLPEIWQTGFMRFDRYVSDAQTMDGPFVQKMGKMAVKYQIYLHTGSFVEKDGDNYYNTSVLFSPDGDILATYRKIHLFGYNSEETQILTPGDTPVVVATPFGNMGMATCFDLRFPELFRAMVDQGADMFLVCSAWPYPRLPAWTMLTRVRALENQCHLVGANCCGINNGIQFAGHSMVVDPWGTVLAGAGDEETIVETSIDPENTDAARKRFPGLAGRKPFLNPGMLLSRKKT